MTALTSLFSVWFTQQCHKTASARFPTRSVGFGQSYRTHFSPADFECRRSGTGSFVFRVQLAGHFLSLSTFCTLQPPLPRRVSAAGTFCLRCQQFWDSEDIFAISALCRSSSAHGKWIIVPPLESRHVRVIVTQLAFFFFFFLWNGKLCPFGAEIVALQDFHFTYFIFLHFTYPTCFLFCSSLFIKAAFNQPHVLHRSLDFNWNIKAMNSKKGHNTLCGEIGLSVGGLVPLLSLK